jgi:hypothetical protein
MEEEHVGVTSNSGAKVTADTKFLLSEGILFLSFLRVLCVLCGARVFSDPLRYD